MGSIAMWLRIMNVSAAFVAAMTLIAASSPGWMFELVLFCAIAWFAVGVAWMLRAIAFAIERKGSSRSRTIASLIIFPTLVLVTSVAVETNAPLCVRIWQSQPALLDAIEQFHAAPEQFLIGGPRHEESLHLGTFRARLDDPGNGVS